MSMKYLNVLRQETLTPLEENEILLDVQEKLSNEKPLKDFLQQFLFPSVEPEVLKVQAELLHQLSGEYQIESLLPFRAFDLVVGICDKLEKNEECTNEVLQIRKYNTQISDLTLLSLKYSCMEVISPFFWYLIEKLMVSIMEIPTKHQYRKFLDHMTHKKGLLTTLVHQGIKSAKCLSMKKCKEASRRVY